MMDKSKAYAVAGMLFALIGIDLIVGHKLVAALAMFVLGIGCCIKAHRRWKHERA